MHDRPFVICWVFVRTMFQSLPDVSYLARAASVSDDGKYVVIGTKHSSLILIDLASGHARYLTQNHCVDVLSIATHPTLPHVLTGEGELVIRGAKVNKRGGLRKEEKREQVCTPTLDPCGRRRHDLSVQLGKVFVRVDRISQY